MILFLLLLLTPPFITYGETMTNSNPVKIASYGTWESPVTAEKIAEGSKRILNLLVDDDGTTYWSELRPSNKGRYTIVRRDKEGNEIDITPPDFNARTFIHEYGGGAFTVKNGVVYSSNGIDHKVYEIKPNQPPRPITEGQIKVEVNGETKHKGTRFADMHVTPYGIVAVGEHHEPEKDVANFLALIDIKSGQYKKLDSGYDFYSSPALSKDGKKIAWISWNHPEMPWTNTELWVADFNNGKLSNKQMVAGDQSESLFQPQWSPEGILYFVSDRKSGWWNIYRFLNGKIENVYPMDAEIGEPLWNFQRSTYAFMGNDKILFTYNSEGLWKLAVLELKTRKLEKIPSKATVFHQLRSGNNFVQFLQTSPNKEEELVQLNNESGYPQRILKTKESLAPEGYISYGQHISYRSNGRMAHAFYFPPRNKDYQAPANENPPLVVMIHGGPTAQAKGDLNWSRQYWTSRGFAVLDVNYGGSTGYGREYRNLLKHNWGIVDVEDCINGALYLVSKGLVDPEKLVIRGGSAGGYTTLASLAFHNIFKAGGNYFGIADLTIFDADTHKFEKKYNDYLLGKLPENRDVWVKRSPINSVQNIRVPLIIFQGEDDAIVPKNQSIMIYEALKKNGIPVEMHIYSGEEHGFRQAKNIIHSLKREAEFYLETFAKQKENLSK